MAFRTVVIANEAELHVRAGQLLACADSVVSIPTEDIAVLILESPRARVSAAALALLAEAGVAVAVCDSKHMPAGILLPSNRHSRQLAVTRNQLSATVPQKKRLWQQLVKAKIRNQAQCLRILGIPGGDRMRDYASQVQSGDTTGLEATAARFYFRRLLKGARRHGGSRLDGSLDYGYAIVRAAVARSLAAHGLYPAIGIHHDSQLNEFNLADDVLEPFRPFVDLAVVHDDLDVEERAGRAALVDVLNTRCELLGRQHSVLTAVESVVVSLAQSLVSKDHTRLTTPALTDATGPTYAIAE